ncbi:VacJ family lipoprotein [Donghicola sp. C2-DW-16]|uniref:VacJ family lipoprotein n=1 Tax=Donghicola mangrovi TaxID=2729614 RepID=A0ABX2P9D0_9RHOB|nr:VacJ family lipoprotein [Donghicola mangrovi]
MARPLSTGRPVQTRKPTATVSKRAATLCAVIALGITGACTSPKPGEMVNDPYEKTNRKIHNMSKGLDTAVVRPVSMAYGKAVPNPVRIGVSNVADNLTLPSMVLNGILQGDGELVLNNSFRFVINSTYGLGGLLDPASKMGLTQMDTDFGETLHVWGAKEGAYLEVPLMGPSTTRDLTGKAVDAVINPVSVLTPLTYTAARRSLSVAEKLDDRYRYDETISSTLYESADSYSQTRLLYLQNRRFELGQSSGGSDDSSTLFDPYEDPYAE